jgi:type IV pilus assembly protein PilW
MKIMMRKQAGLSLVELMVAMAIGSFLMIGAVQIYNQSRQAFVVNESIARVQETAQFAMDTIEADLRMASNWGRNSRPLAVEGRSIMGTANPNGLAQPAGNCAADWVLNLALPIDGVNNGYGLDCAATGGSQANSDVITIRRASVAHVDPLAGQLQIQSTRIQSEIFHDGSVPGSFAAASAAGASDDPRDPAFDSETHNLIVTSYYVSPTSELIYGVPTLRRHRLVGGGVGGPRIVDEEVAPGIENLQIQLGVDVDADNTVDRYVNAGSAIYNPTAVGYIPGARIITARVWMIVRGVSIEPGLRDARDYKPGDVDLGTKSDDFRRMQVSKTILLRNART